MTGVGQCLVVAWSLLFAPATDGVSRPSFDDLIANLKSPNAKTREEAASALGKSRKREAVPALAALVRDPEPKVRFEVVKALGELRDLAAVPAVITSLQDGDPKVREEAVGVLVELFAERERSNPVSRFLEIFSDEYDRSSVPAYTLVDGTVYRALAGALRDEDKGIREEAALALGILGGSGQVNDLVALLNDVAPGVRGAAATAIGKVGSGEEGKALIPLLEDENAAVRNRVLGALGVLRVKEAGPRLRQLYEANRRKEVGVRYLACLARIGDPSQADLLRELVTDADPEKKRLAIEGLGRISDEGMLPAFKKDYQRERNEELKLAYNFALVLLGDKAFLDSIVLSLSSRTLGTRCRSYILELGRTVAADLYPYLEEADADVRAAVCDLLAQIGDVEAIPRIEPLINDTNTNVADHANRAVERLKRSSRGTSSR
jgi:HEAT repeat protein